jgi:hypothetical protein
MDQQAQDTPQQDGNRLAAEESSHNRDIDKRDNQIIDGLVTKKRFDTQDGNPGLYFQFFMSNFAF